MQHSAVTLPVRAANREGVLCKLSVWQANVCVRLSHRRFQWCTALSIVQTVGLGRELSHRRFERRAAQIVAQTVRLANERTCSAVPLTFRALHRERALCKLSVWQVNVRVWLSHRQFERRTAQIVVQTVALARECMCSAVKLRVRSWFASKHTLSPPFRVAKQRRSIVQTVGLAREHVRSVVKPPVRASHSTDRCANCRFGCHIAGSSVAECRALCKLSVCKANIRIRLSHRLFERRTAQITVQFANCRFAK